MFDHETNVANSIWDLANALASKCNNIKILGTDPNVTEHALFEQQPFPWISEIANALRLHDF